MKPTIPFVLKAEHEALHKMLEQAIVLSGKTGTAAEKVARLLLPHIIREEQYALPPLGFLPALARGVISFDVDTAISQAGQMKNVLPQMLAEHQQIVAALEELVKAAEEERHPEAVDFAEKLKEHARMEEEVLYPAAILVGEYLKLRLGREEKEPGSHLNLEIRL